MASYTTSLFRDITPHPPPLLERTHSQRTATTPGISSPDDIFLSLDPLTPGPTIDTLIIDFTLSNARRFYSSMERVLGRLRFEWVKH